MDTMNNIINYINAKPVIAILIIIILILILYRLYVYYVKTESNEYFTSEAEILPVPGGTTIVTNPTNSTILDSPETTVLPINPVPTVPSTVPKVVPISQSQKTLQEVIPFVTSQAELMELLQVSPTLQNKFNELLSKNINYNTDGSILVRFKYVDPNDNKVYYIATQSLTQCTDASNLPGCVSNILVLVPENKVNEETLRYTNDMNINQQVCNYKKTLQNGQNTNSANICTNNVTLYPECNVTKQMPYDFVVSKVNAKPNIKFVIQGVTAETNNGRNSLPVYINKATGKNELCADALYFANKYVEVDLVSTRIENNGGVIGGLTPEIKTKIRFKVTETINSAVVTNTLYVGKCINKSCTMDNASYMKLCLYSDILDPNVIEFQPIAKTYIN